MQAIVNNNALIQPSDITPAGSGSQSVDRDSGRDDREFAKLIPDHSTKREESTPATKTSMTNTPASQSVAKSAPEDNTQRSDDAQGSEDKAAVRNAFFVAAEQLLGSDGLPRQVEADAPKELAEEESNPDVTAIMPESSSSVQPAGDTNLLNGGQSMTILALAAQMEKTMEALQSQPKAPPSNPLANIASPIAPVLVGDAPETTDAMLLVTPLVNVLGDDQAGSDSASKKDASFTDLLPGATKPVTVALPTDSAKAEIVVNAIKQATQPVVDAMQTQQTQLKISVEETVDPSVIMQNMQNSAPKPVQKLPELVGAKKTNEELLASLQQVLAGRTDREAPITAPLGQVSTHAALPTLDVGADTGKNDFSSLSQNTNPLSLLTTGEHARQAAQVDSTFSRMLQQTTHTPVADQVMVHIKSAVSDGNSHIKIQLDPVELGRVDVRMDVGRDGRTVMTITADNKDTLEMLQREVKHLERSLSDLGLKTDTGGLSFHLRQQQQEQKFTRNQTGYSAAAVEEVEPELAVGLTNTYRLQVQEGVDIRV